MSFGMTGVIHLEDLSKDDPMYLGQSEGDLHFRECQIDIEGGLRKLSLAEVVALALTERCCRIGREKVCNQDSCMSLYHPKIQDLASY